MAQILAPQLIALTQDALIKVFWRKRALRQFLKQHGITDSFLNTWHDEETKRDFLYRLYDALLTKKDNIGHNTILKIAYSLSKLTEFPDLDNWEDTREKKQSAKEAIQKLKIEIDKIDASFEKEKEALRKRKDANEARLKKIESLITLDGLKNDLCLLVAKQGTSEGGYEFEKWLYRLYNHFDIQARPPYKANGRQIDGSITIDGTTYLVEAKFQIGPIGSEDVDIFYSKVISKADNTMGLFISMSGFNPGAIKTASRDRTPILLMDFSHIYQLIFPELMSLKDVITRIKRHASQTGEAYIAVANFSD